MCVKYPMDPNQAREASYFNREPAHGEKNGAVLSETETIANTRRREETPVELLLKVYILYRY